MCSVTGTDGQAFIIRRGRRLSDPVSVERLRHLAASGVVKGADIVLDAATRQQVGIAGDQPWFAAPIPGAPAPKLGLLAGRHLLGLHYSPWQLIMAFAIAIPADLVGWIFAIAPIVSVPIDVVIGVLLWLALGRPVALVATVLWETIPGLSIVPAWTLVVGAIAIYGGLPGISHATPSGAVGTATGLAQGVMTRFARKG
jgi:hypothetical protein